MSPQQACAARAAAELPKSATAAPILMSLDFMECLSWLRDVLRKQTSASQADSTVSGAGPLGGPYLERAILTLRERRLAGALLQAQPAASCRPGRPNSRTASCRRNRADSSRCSQPMTRQPSARRTSGNSAAPRRGQAACAWLDDRRAAMPGTRFAPSPRTAAR